MSTIYLHRRMTALEIREPTKEACERLAAERELFANFRQPQQDAFDGYSGSKGRKRIGNGKHKEWHINFQEDPPQTDKPRVVGTLILESHFDITKKQFGGWDYGKYDANNPDYAPTYNVVNLGTIDPERTWKGMGHWLPHVLEPELLDLATVAIREALLPQDPLPFDNL